MTFKFLIYINFTYHRKIKEKINRVNTLSTVVHQCFSNWEPYYYEGHKIFNTFILFYRFSIIKILKYLQTYIIFLPSLMSYNVNFKMCNIYLMIKFLK